MNKFLKIYGDGGARGNPGPAGIGVVIIEPSGQKRLFKKFIGRKTNNQAEYAAVFFALKLAVRDYLKVKEIIFYLDSMLVVKQLKGDYKIKNEKLGRFLIKIRNLIIRHNLCVKFIHLPRENNLEADRLVNLAIDEEDKKK